MNAAEAERQEGEEGSVEGGERRMSRKERGVGHVKHITNAVKEAPCCFPYLKIIILKGSCNKNVSLSAIKCVIFTSMACQVTNQVQINNKLAHFSGFFLVPALNEPFGLCSTSNERNRPDYQKPGLVAMFPASYRLQ